MAFKNILIVAGVTVNLKLICKDNDGNTRDLTGGVAQFAMNKRGLAKHYILRNCTVYQDTVSVTITSSETLAYGGYDYEIKFELLGETESLIVGEINIAKAPLPVII